MTGDIFGDNEQTFANSIGFAESDFLDESGDSEGEESEVSVESQKIVFDIPKEFELEDASELPEGDLDSLKGVFGKLTQEITKLCDLLANINVASPSITASCKYEDDEELDVDLDSLIPQKKGSPGRPAKQKPKLAVTMGKKINAAINKKSPTTIKKKPAPKSKVKKSKKR